jgi:hypothetical protein
MQDDEDEFPRDSFCDVRFDRITKGSKKPPEKVTCYATGKIFCRSHICPRQYSPGMRTIPLCLLSLQCRMQAHRNKMKHRELQLEIFWLHMHKCQRQHTLEWTTENVCCFRAVDAASTPRPLRNSSWTLLRRKKAQVLSCT